MKHTKSKLISSIVVLVVCFAMLIGSTFAWFTDSASTGINKIQSGNLNIELYHSSTGSPNEQVTEQTELFKIDTWEPGVYVYENLSIKNEGNLALKYTLDFDLDNTNYYRNYVVEKEGDNVIGTNRSLADVLYVKISNGIFSGDRPSLTTSDGIILSNFLETPNNYLDTGALEAGAVKNISVIIYWPESSIDNGYNLKNGWYSSAAANSPVDDGQNKLKIQFPILLSATQYTSEYDSFGNDYDREPGQQPPFVKPVSTSSAPVNNNTKTELNTDKGSVVIPEDSGLPEDTVAHLEIIEVQEANGNLTITDNNTVVSYEVELLDQNGNKIDLSSVDQKTILARVEVGYGLDVNRISVYRDGTTPLTIVKYEDGYVHFESDHFCDVDVVLPDVVARVGNTYFYDYNEAAENLSAGAVIDGIKNMDSMKTAIIAKHGDKFVVESDNENHTITLKASVAKIGDVTYDSLEAAFKASTDEDVILLVDNGTCGIININNKNIIFDLNGYSLENNGADGFYLRNSTLTLQDSSENSTGIINHTGRYDLADVSNNSKLIITSGTYNTSGSYGILYTGYNGESGIIGGKFNTDDVDCAEGYDVELEDGWYIPKQYFNWIDHKSDDYYSLDEENKLIEISAPAELALLAYNVNNGQTYSGYTIKLISDIDLSGKRWTPIGRDGKPFSGLFDGNNHKISNIYIKSNESHLGLFGFIKKSSYTDIAVQDLYIENIVINSASNYQGALSGKMFTTGIKNINISGASIGEKYNGNWHGGIVGHAYGNITNSTFEGSVYGYQSIAGICGAADPRIDKCSAIADVEGYYWVGGIIGGGQENASSINSSFKGKVTSQGSYYWGIGGITGASGHYNTIVYQNNYFDGEVYLGSEKVYPLIFTVNGSYSDTPNCTFTNNSFNSEYYPEFNDNNKSYAVWMDDMEHSYPSYNYILDIARIYE